MERESGFKLNYLPIKIYLNAAQEAALPEYLGSTIRGALGQVLYSDAKSYTYLYKNRNLGGGQDTVNPYILIPPPERQEPYKKDEELSFEIVLLGQAVDYALPLITKLIEAKGLALGVNRHWFILKKITHGLHQRVIWQGRAVNTIALESINLPFLTLAHVKQVTLNMYTPLRIRRNGELLKNIDFKTIVRNITGRISAIAERYGGWVDKEEIDRLQELSAQVIAIQSNLRIKNISRYSNRLKEKMDFSGLVGSITFEGEMTPFVAWLYAAQVLHIGRNTTFGMGKIGVEFV